MVRFSVGDEEEEEDMVIRWKRRRGRNRGIEGENGNKVQKFGGNQEEFEGELSEEEDEGGGENGEESSGIEKNEAISVTIDPDVLECSICCEPLRAPLYQCQNGHVACSVCCPKLPEDKCPTCSQSINFSRCRALEKVIESIKSSCCYSRYGCSKIFSYIEKSSHQETCTYAPCFCPMPNCTFYGFPEQVSTHFGAHHGGSAIDFQYDKQFKVDLKQDQPFVVLHEQRGLLFLLLNDKFIDRGNALSVACIHPSSVECDFVYELMVPGAESSLQLKASATNVRKWVGVYPSKIFLLVPKNFCSSFGEIILNVCIQKKRMRSSFC